MKCVVASRLNVFGTGVQQENELIPSIRTKSPHGALLTEHLIQKFRDWVDACNTNAPAGVLDDLRSQAERAREELNSFLKSVIQ